MKARDYQREYRLRNKLHKRAPEELLQAPGGSRLFAIVKGRRDGRTFADIARQFAVTEERIRGLAHNLKRRGFL